MRIEHFKDIKTSRATGDILAKVTSSVYLILSHNGGTIRDFRYVDVPEKQTGEMIKLHEILLIDHVTLFYDRNNTYLELSFPNGPEFTEINKGFSDDEFYIYESADIKNNFPTRDFKGDWLKVHDLKINMEADNIYFEGKTSEGYIVRKYINNNLRFEAFFDDAPDTMCCHLKVDKRGIANYKYKRKIKP